MSDIKEFRQINLSEKILSALDKIGFVEPTPIQAATIPLLLDGVDLLGKAQTGTGKTAAFALPLLNNIDLKQHKPQAIIMAPTRELAIQVAAEVKLLGQNIDGLKVLEVYGGASIVEQMRALKRGTHIVVGTPGRVKDLISRNKLHLGETHTFILDEADEMLNMGFVDDVTEILEHAPETAQRVLFSATMPPMLKNIVNRFLRDPKHIDVAGKNKTVEKVEQQYWVARGVDKDEAMLRLLETEDSDANIVFVRTKQDTERLSDWLSARGFNSSALHGDIPQSLRERTVDQLKKGVIDILVATDVVARGLDVPRITHVYNYDIPFDVESYIHRIGRTGRAGRKGKAILLVRTNQIRMLRTIERVTNSKMHEIDLPVRDAVAKARVARLTQELSSHLEDSKLEAFTNIVEDIQNTLEVDAQTLAAILLKRQQGKRPLFYNGPDPMVASIERDYKRRQERRENRGGERKGEGRRGDRNKRYANVADWDTYQLQVGREHGVQVKDIVGAIANELGLQKQHIGAIKLQQGHTYVQLPKEMPKDKFQQLQKLRIRQSETQAQRVEDNVLREHGAADERGKNGNGGKKFSRFKQDMQNKERRYDRNRGNHKGRRS